MDFRIQRPRIDRYDRDRIVKELKAVAEHFNYQWFTTHDFNRVSKSCKSTVVLKNFVTWEAAMNSVGIKPGNQRKPRKDQILERELFLEMERVWKLLEHRPSKAEWEASKPKYSYTTYKTRFSGWVNACAKFIDWKGGQKPFEDVQVPVSSAKPKLSKQNMRNIPLKIRLRVFNRDNFKCVFCGKSPAMNSGVVLHVDHVVPFSKSGETTFENLQTLCNECNWGKGAEGST